MQAIIVQIRQHLFNGLNDNMILSFILFRFIFVV